MAVQRGSIEFRVLGPLEVLVDGRPVTIGGPKPRTLLALLLLHAGRAVPVERIVDELWTTAPAGAAQSVQMHVSRLRRALPRAGALVTRPAGYALELDPAQLDLHAFEALAEAGHAALREGDVRRARAALEQALARWRGQPLDGVALGPELVAEAARLVELRKLLADGIKTWLADPAVVSPALSAAIAANIVIDPPGKASGVNHDAFVGENENLRKALEMVP
jgi:DNA-binding SARP family transcriptional activator